MRIAIIGSSGHNYYVLESMNQVPEASICAIAPGCAEEDMSSLVNNPAVEKFSPKYYSNYREMLDEERPDIVAVNPFYYLHAEITTEALNRGIAVFCEKPLALDMESLERVRDAQKKSGAGLGMMLAYRYDPRFYTAHQLVREEAIGVPTVGFAQKSYKLGIRPWFYEKRETFGGLIPWVGIHAIDWFRWVSGTEYAAVNAYHSNVHARQYAGMEDVAGCMFELTNGGVAVMSFDFLRPSGAPTHGDDRLRLVGSKGALEISDQVGLLLTDDKGTNLVELRKPPYDIFADLAMTVVDPNHRCLISPEDAIEITRVSLLARDSADDRRRVAF